MKSKVAKKGHRRAKSVPVGGEAETKKAATKKGKPAGKIPELPKRHVRSSSLNEKPAGFMAAPRRASRSTSHHVPRPHETMSRPLGEEELLIEDRSPWTVGHSRNSSLSSTATQQLPPFFPMSPIGRGGHHHPGAPYHHGNSPQHIFSCFQEPKANGGRPPMSPMHRSWSPRDFHGASQHFPYRPSIGGDTCYSDGDINYADGDIEVSSLEQTFDSSTFTMEDDMQLGPLLSEETSHGAVFEPIAVGSGEANEKPSLGSNPVKDTMDDSDTSDLQYSSTLACDFGDGKGNALDDVVMKDIDPADDDAMSPLPFFGETDITLLDNLPDLLQMPIAPICYDSICLV